MAFSIKDKPLQAKLERHLHENRQAYADSLEKLSSGTIFTSNDPRPAERALAEGLEYKIRSMTSSKRNINNAVTLLQTAESSLSEISNMVIRMKEINVAAASTTLSDKERRFLFIEYEALHDEINRVAISTEYNGMPLLNGLSPDSPDELIFRVGDPFYSDEAADGDDINVIRFQGLKNVVATTAGLGIQSARDMLLDSSEGEGLAIDDVMDLMVPEDDDLFDTTYDQAMNMIATQRAVFGGMQSRMHRAMDFIDVYQENIMAAKSNIADVDYAAEVGRMVQAKMLTSAATSVLAQGNVHASLALTLIDRLV